MRADSGKVNGRDAILIPLIKTRPGDVSYDVEVVWSQAGGKLAPRDRRKFHEAELIGITVEQTFWAVWLPDSRALLLDYAARFDAIVREQGGRSALFSVWPAYSRRGDFDRAIESYALAADEVNGVMLPAATAWLEAWKRDPELRLYQDDLHPTQAGTYLAALVIASRLYGRAPAEFPAEFAVPAPGWTGPAVPIDPAVAATLRAAAQAALERHPEPFGVQHP